MEVPGCLCWPWPSSCLLLLSHTSPGGRHMLSELLNRKSASRSARAPFHVVSLIPRAGFQKRFIVSVLQSYAPFNVSVFKRWGERASVKTCVLYASQLRGRAAQGGETAIWPPGSQHGAWMDSDDIHWPLSQAHAYLCLLLCMVGSARIPAPFPSGVSCGQEDAGLCFHTSGLTHQHPGWLFTWCIPFT